MTQVIIDPQPNVCEASITTLPPTSIIKAPHTKVCEASITTLPPTLPNINKLRPHTLRVIGFLSLDIKYTTRQYFLKYHKYNSY